MLTLRRSPVWVLDARFVFPPTPRLRRARRSATREDGMFGSCSRLRQGYGGLAVAQGAEAARSVRVRVWFAAASNLNANGAPSTQKRERQGLGSCRPS